MPDSRHSSEITINAYEIIAVLFLASITKLLSGDQTTAVPTIQLQHFLLVKKKTSAKKYLNLVRASKCPYYVKNS